MIVAIAYILFSKHSFNFTRFPFFTACIAKIRRGTFYLVIVLPYSVHNCFCIQLFIKRMLNELMDVIISLFDDRSSILSIVYAMQIYCIHKKHNEIILNFILSLCLISFLSYVIVRHLKSYIHNQVI